MKCFLMVKYNKIEDLSFTKWYGWIVPESKITLREPLTLFTHYLKHNNQIIKLYSFNMTTFFALFRFQFLNIISFNLEIQRFRKKLIKNSISWQGNQNFQDFHNDYFITQKTILKKKLSKIELWVYKHVHRLSRLPKPSIHDTI